MGNCDLSNVSLEEIKRIKWNIVDFMKPFLGRKYYTKEMEGSYSIKKVLPAMCPDDDELDCSKLSLIHKGDEESNAFLSIKNETPEKQKNIRKALLEYCKLDTHVMIKIWEKFMEVTGDD